MLASDVKIDLIKIGKYYSGKFSRSNVGIFLFGQLFLMILTLQNWENGIFS
jgi:hypothetical protein